MAVPARHVHGHRNAWATGGGRGRGVCRTARDGSGRGARGPRPYRGRSGRGRGRSDRGGGARRAAPDARGSRSAATPTRASAACPPPTCRRRPTSCSSRHGLATTSYTPVNITRTNKATVLTNRSTPQSHFLHDGWPTIVVQ